MKECGNSKIHTSSNFILSVRLLIMLNTYIQAVQLPDYEAIYQCTRRNILGDNIQEHNYDYPR